MIEAARRNQRLLTVSFQNRFRAEALAAKGIRLRENRLRNLQTRVDKMMALIEARSCERFKRLSEGMDDAYLRKFYRKFMESEAGHYTLFITLAEHYLDKKMVRQRWAEWLQYEKQLMHEMEVRGDRIH